MLLVDDPLQAVQLRPRTKGRCDRFARILGPGADPLDLQQFPIAARNPVWRRRVRQRVELLTPEVRQRPHLVPLPKPIAGNVAPWSAQRVRGEREWLCSEGSQKAKLRVVLRSFRAAGLE